MLTTVCPVMSCPYYSYNRPICPSTGLDHSRRDSIGEYVHKLTQNTLSELHFFYFSFEYILIKILLRTVVLSRREVRYLRREVR